MKKNILDSIFSATIKLLLRRTLVRSGMLFNGPHPDLPPTGGRPSATQASLTKPFSFSAKLFLKQGLCIALPRWGSWRGPLLCVFVALWLNGFTQQATWTWYPGDFGIVFNFKLNDNQISI